VGAAIDVFKSAQIFPDHFARHISRRNAVPSVGQSILADDTHWPDKPRARWVSLSASAVLGAGLKGVDYLEDMTKLSDLFSVGAI